MGYIRIKLLVVLALTSVSYSTFSQSLEKLNTHVYNWDQLSAQKTKTGEKRQIFEGNTNVLSYFEVHATTLDPGSKPHGGKVPSDLEELIIVKEGKVLNSMNGGEKLLGPGSVVLVSPGTMHKISNGGSAPATYFILRWKIDGPVDMKRTEMAGGSMCYDWNEIEFRPNEKGGTRRIMRRPTATLSELEMHVTTLNENTPSHAEHVHESEEIILVIKGEVEESINGTPHQAGPGSLILLLNKDAHGIRNIGKGQCEYFAFRWDI